MNPHDLILFTLQASVMVTVFAFGLEATVRDVMYVWRRPTRLLRALVAMFIIMPVVALGLSRALGVMDEVKIALVCLAISPIPPLLPKKQDKAGGSASFALGLMVTMAILAVAIIPFSLNVLGHYFSRPLAMPPHVIALMVLKGAIAPLVVGMIFRGIAPAIAQRIARPMKLIAGILLAVAGLVVLYAVREAILSLVGVQATLIAMFAFIVIGLVVGHLLGGPVREDRIVLAMSTASRHPGIAIGLATANYPGNQSIAVAILLYLVLGVVVSIAYMKWQESVGV
ncbi:hypothetical protein QTI66_00515 [Variovorax sp. J22R133]|uniref:bile acid:sodium symporter family protein n=1 Tax=Variovorax brevis TaxID=3053503 RepID=UPI002574CEFD|nr:hypothetical protein [Variovorax sp. J22R133]MDM0110607.1 hypothetical protein [Variovorax sp. J22R133]